MKIAVSFITPPKKDHPMATKPRIVAPNVLYQISSKGVKDLKMFEKNELKIFFFEQLKQTLKKYSLTLYAFALTINQYYLIVKSSEQSISNAMQHFNSGIAKKTNKVLERDGTVFATRFKSAITEDDRLKEIIKYVHLQPVNEGICTFDDLHNYKWCSHSVFTGKNISELIDTESVLQNFGQNPKADYIKYMQEKDGNKEITEILNNVNNARQGFHEPQLWIIGKPDFVKYVMDKDQCRRMRIARHIREDIDMERIHDEVTILLQLDKSSLFQAGQLNVKSTARELFAALCKQRYDFTEAQTARYLNITDSAVSRMIFRFNNINNKDYLINRVVEVISIL